MESYKEPVCRMFFNPLSLQIKLPGFLVLIKVKLFTDESQQTQLLSKLALALPILHFQIYYYEEIYPSFFTNSGCIHGFLPA